MRAAFAAKMKRARAAKRGGRRRNPKRKGSQLRVGQIVNWKTGEGSIALTRGKKILGEFSTMKEAQAAYRARRRRKNPGHRGYVPSGALKNKHSGNWAFCPYCDKVVARLERKGLTTSDAQGVAMAEHMESQRKTNPTKAQVKAAAGKLARVAGRLAWRGAKLGGRTAKAGAKAAAAEVKASLCRPRAKNPKRKWTAAMRAAFARKMAKYRKPGRRRMKNRRAIAGAARKVFILAEKGNQKLWFNGAHFSNRSKAVHFSSVEKAKAKAQALIRQFPVLRSYAVSLVAP